MDLPVPRGAVAQRLIIAGSAHPVVITVIATMAFVFREPMGEAFVRRVAVLKQPAQVVRSAVP